MSLCMMCLQWQKWKAVVRSPMSSAVFFSLKRFSSQQVVVQLPTWRVLQHEVHELALHEELVHAQHIHVPDVRLNLDLAQQLVVHGLLVQLLES